MTVDEYLYQIILKHSKIVGNDSPQYQIAKEEFYNVIVQWAKNELIAVYISGSYAKGTNVSGSSDLDLFISLRQFNESLRHHYIDLFNFLDQYYHTRQQNVSIGVNYKGYHFDFTPGRIQTTDNDHSIFVRRKNTWTKTNVFKHIDIVKNSNRTNDIKAIKIWRNLHNLDFPSFYLELSVIKSRKMFNIFGYCLWVSFDLSPKQKFSNGLI